MGTIEAICISSKRGTAKKAVDSAEFVAEQGILGDAHAGDWHRQVSILTAESIETMKEKLPHLAQGAFAENIITRGVDLSDIHPGERIQISSSVILEVTQIGKECHEACAIRTVTGDCIMPTEGVFARVLQGGAVKPGDSIEKIESPGR